MIPDTRIEERLLSDTVAARQRIVDVVAQWYTHGSADAKLLSASAGSSLDQYAHDLLHRLIDAARGGWDDQAADWVRQRVPRRPVGAGNVVAGSDSRVRSASCRRSGAAATHARSGTTARARAQRNRIVLTDWALGFSRGLSAAGVLADPACPERQRIARRISVPSVWPSGVLRLPQGLAAASRLRTSAAPRPSRCVARR